MNADLFSVAKCVIRILAALLLMACATPFWSQTRTFISFEAKGAGTGIGQGTVATCINSAGTVAGHYADSNYKAHGFVRSVNGRITEFDVAGLQGTEVSGINSNGQIIGNAQNEYRLRFNYAYLRNPDGAIVLLYVPGDAVTTVASGINDTGQITGFYIDGNNSYHGFLRDAGGGYTNFDEPNAVIEGFNEGTFARTINGSGTVAGEYSDSGGAYHGFTRDDAGNYISFDTPGAGSCYECGTEPTAMNSSGQIAGTYIDNSYKSHGFFRDAAGNITQFDVPGALDTYATSIGDNGEILGAWQSGFGWFAYIRDATGNITALNSALFPTGINSAGTITGLYANTNEPERGFIATF